jgi:hypothetical protein
MKMTLKNNVPVVELCVLVFGLLLLLISCKNNEPTPSGQEEGRFIFYTQLDKTEFDAIDIYVDQKFAGKLISPNSKRPDCNQATIGDMVKVDVRNGHHKWSAKQFLGGKQIDEWYERTVEVSAGDCEFIKLTE